MTMIDNPRKFELYYALVQARAIRDTIDDVLATARTALEDGAWEGGTSPDFVGEMGAQEKVAVTAGDDAVDVVQTEYTRTPAKIPGPKGPEPV